MHYFLDNTTKESKYQEDFPVKKLEKIEKNEREKSILHVKKNKTAKQKSATSRPLLFFKPKKTLEQALLI